MRAVPALALIAALVAAPAAAQVRFTDVTDASGLADVSATNFSWADYDNDGDPDLLVGCSRLFRNEGPPGFNFTDVTAASGLAGNHGTWADLDNDGDLDLYCAGRDQNARLWRNEGDGTFTDISDFDGNGSRDMTVDSPSVTGAWGDYDLDGFVDMYVGNYERTGNADCDIDTLWRNRGDGTFENTTTAAGIEAGESAIVNADPGMCARGVNWGDYNNDGWPDIYVADYRLDANMLFENDGDGTFSEVAAARGVDGHEDSGSWGHSLGTEFFDMDNDGDLDVYTGNLAHWWGTFTFGHDISYLWRNNGAAAGYDFTDVRASSGMHGYSAAFVDTNDFEEAGPGWADWDNDTVPDLYVTEFYPFRDHWGRLYRGLGGGTFEDVSDPGNGDCPTGSPGHEQDPVNTAVGPACLKRWYAWNAAWADYDGDGDLDLAVSGNPIFHQCGLSDLEPEDPPPTPECEGRDPSNRDTWPQPRRLWLFRNEVGNQNRWLHVRAVGQLGNRAAIGARVTVDAGGVSMMREVSGGHGYHAAQHDLPVEFGLGTATQADSVTVRWPTPGAPTTQVTGVAADQRLVAYESGADVRRGTAPDALSSYRSATFFPWTDPEPVLDPGPPTLYYRLDDAGADIRVDKDAAAASITIRIVN